MAIYGSSFASVMERDDERHIESKHFCMEQPDLNFSYFMTNALSITILKILIVHLNSLLAG